MGLASGHQPLPYGHTSEAAVDIEGLSVCQLSNIALATSLTLEQLLEDHLQKLREEEGLTTEDDHAVWHNWEIQSDSSSDDASDGWINVDDDGDDNFVLSDSDDELEKSDGPPPAAAPRTSTLATSKA